MTTENDLNYCMVLAYTKALMWDGELWNLHKFFKQEVQKKNIPADVVASYWASLGTSFSKVVLYGNIGENAPGESIADKLSRIQMASDATKFAFADMDQFDEYVHFLNDYDWKCRPRSPGLSRTPLIDIGWKSVMAKVLKDIG